MKSIDKDLVKVLLDLKNADVYHRVPGTTDKVLDKLLKKYANHIWKITGTASYEGDFGTVHTWTRTTFLYATKEKNAKATFHDWFPDTKITKVEIFIP